MAWEVTGVKIFRSDSALKGEASVRTSWGLITGFKVMKKDDKIWVNAPQVPYKDKDGNTKYKYIVKFNDEGKGAEILKQISEDVIKAYKEEVRKQKDENSDDDDRPKKRRDDDNDDDYKPKKKSYDDDDDRPKKKRDDDDSDDRPKKKKSYDDGIDISDDF